MVLLGVIYVITSFSGRTQVSLVGLLSGLGPFLFAATVTYMKPSDQRFLYGAVLIGVGRGLDVLVQLIVAQSVVVNELTSFLLQVAQLIETPLFLAGVVLIGLGAGSVRTRAGLAIVLVGLVVGLAKLVWSWSVSWAPFVEGMPLGEIPIATIGASLATSFVYSLAWAFVLAASFESKRRLLLLGSLIFAALDVLSVALSIANMTEEADAARLFLVLGVASLIGWLILAVSPLRLEMGTQRPLRDAAETDVAT
jgi:hypothetical protein